MGKKIEMKAYEPIPEYTGLENITSIEIREGCEWYGHAYATCVGMIYDDGTVESYFKKDVENGDTKIFDKLRDDIRLIKKHVHLVDCETREERSGNRYFVPYKVQNHCSDKPTVTDCYVDGCSNVHYSVEYEILLVADEDLKRYITIEYETEGTFSSSFFDQIENICDIFEDWFEEETYGFKIVDSDYRTVVFYDESGESCDVNISSTRELLRMIASIRVIRCDQKLTD